MSLSSYLFCTATLLCFFAATATPTDIWHVSIDEAPAPPPGKGAPIQASALRNLSWLPAQIGGIVAAYVVSVLFIGTALLFVGRRLRRAAQQSPKTLAMEMMQPVKRDQQSMPKAFDPSPISPATSKNVYGPSPNGTIGMKNGWPSPVKGRSRRGSDGWGSLKKGHTRNQPSVQSSVVTFDENVIESDLERNQREMERLYAAVMDHEDRKSESQTDVGSIRQPLSPTSPQIPPEFQHLQTAQPSGQPPRSDTASPGRTLTKSPRSSKKPTPLSLHSRNSSRSSTASFNRRGIRGLPISPPMGSPGLVPDNTYEDSEPLSPRIYVDPGPPPPTPPQIKAYNDRSDRLSPRDARFPDNRFPEPSRTPRTAIPTSPAVDTIPEQYQSNIPQPRPFNQSGLSFTDSNRARRHPDHLTLRTGPSPSTHQHPLQSAPLPLRNPQAYPTNYNSAEPSIKATVLERPSKAQAMHSARTPRTGVPMTPYSPYMPFTPLTPMTPSRLVTREERKRREREEGRRVVTVEDAVVEEADAWGEALN